jgi:hypothetical protein
MSSFKNGKVLGFRVLKFENEEEKVGIGKFSDLKKVPLGI